MIPYHDLTRSVIGHPRFAERRNEYLRWYPKSLATFDGDWRPNESVIAGAYIHIPFCERICRFCPFNKRLKRQEEVDRFAKALSHEILLLSRARSHAAKLDFIYFGGGTPSVLSPRQIAVILRDLDSGIGLSPDVEVTLETHPNHATRSYVSEVIAAGITRISMGIQSFEEDMLRELGATHAATQSFAAIDSAMSACDNVAIDLLYSYQKQGIDSWRSELTTAIVKLGVKHLSCYALVPINSDFVQPSQPEEITLAVEALNFAAESGLYHYASCASGGFDVAAPSFECRYERRHWAAPQAGFYGLGPGAFGFAGGQTTVNRLSVPRYCDDLERGALPIVSVLRVEEDELRHRYFALGVKALSVPLTPYREIFGRDPLDDFNAEIESLLNDNFAEIKHDALVLTPIGRLYVDVCSATFYSSVEREVPHPEEPEIRKIELELSIENSSL